MKNIKWRRQTFFLHYIEVKWPQVETEAEVAGHILSHNQNLYLWCTWASVLRLPLQTLFPGPHRFSPTNHNLVTRSPLLICKAFTDSPQNSCSPGDTLPGSHFKECYNILIKWILGLSRKVQLWCCLSATFSTAWLTHNPIKRTHTRGWHYGIVS